MDKKIIWTKKAKEELFDILNYWKNRNKSNLFSLKLYELIEEQLQLILDFPEIGRPTDIPNVYVKVIQNYLLYFEFIDNTLYILTLRHRSRNPKTLKIR
ncbi:hypothetical protein PK35_09065 [Tamlana nanhaiensis]|uniref:Type II toxin-antitoxin system RelE/ParE family toxin n=1 Tax=Neotamlana nanhaiensis TaxID=1382798 RepID=A0A0D7W1Y5_9FLAO|nr:type II toxin-antitoxin system RelE/ParE family toxin [Tamlana nanhaiensis]KJD33101.1 hypothetical protein PK35_09065 [Tamlana nanhaiensis]